MKKIVFLSGIISSIMLAAPLHAQIASFTMATPGHDGPKESIDLVQFAVQYQTKMILDTMKPDKIQEETMMLKVGAKSSVYYSYTHFVSDSILKEQIRQNGYPTFDGNNPRPQSIITYQIYKNYPAGKVTTLDRLVMNRFRCEEENEIPVWQLLSDTMTILSYPCQKAVCHFKGRDYEAWFTPEIPRNEGPWKLHGLPGLILKASDRQGHYTFECTGLINTNEELLFGADGYELISRKNLNKIYERFTKDPVGYVQSTTPNVTVHSFGENGAKPEKIDAPYNPIERD